MDLFKSHFGDERIENVKNRLYKEGYVLIVLICVASVIVKDIYFGLAIKHVITEMFILFISSLYIGIRTISLGLYSDQVEVHDRRSKMSMNVKNLFIGLGLGFALALFIGIRSAVLYGDTTSQSIWYFIIVFCATLMIYVPLFIVIFFVGHNAANKASQHVNGNDPNER